MGNQSKYYKNEKEEIINPEDRFKNIKILSYLAVKLLFGITTYKKNILITSSPYSHVTLPFLGKIFYSLIYFLELSKTNYWEINGNLLNF